jgi:hypothetical protein
MTYNYKKSDDTLKMQVLRMQLETIAYCRIKLEKSDKHIIKDYEKIWLNICAEHDIKPENNFVEEYERFEVETLLKFAPSTTLENSESKAILKLEQLGCSI